MNKISINIIEDKVESSGISFKSFFKKDYERHEIYEELNHYEITKDEETFQFHFFKDRPTPIQKYFSIYQQPGSGVKNSSEELFNFILYLNLSIYSDNLPGTGTEYQYEDQIKPLFKEKTNRYKLLIIAVNYNNMIHSYGYDAKGEGKEFEKKQFSRLKSFHEQLLSHSHIETKLIHISPFSNKKYQNDYILNTSTVTFSNKHSDLSSRMNSYSRFDEILEFSRGNDQIMLQEIVYQFIQNQSKITPLELYIKLLPIEYSNINQMLEESIQSLKLFLIESDYLLNDADQQQQQQQQLYNNFYSLYVVSKIENNFSISNWLSDEIIFQTERKKQKKDTSIVLIDDRIMFGNKLLTRIAESGYSDIFQYQFKLDEFNENNQNHQQSTEQYKTLKELFISRSVFFIYSLKVLKYSLSTIEWFMEEKYKSYSQEINLFWQTNILLKSSYDGDLEVFKYILNHKNSVVQVESFLDDFNSIHLASTRGNLNILKYLHQEKDCNLNKSKSFKKGSHAIHCAANEHQLSTVDYLIQDAGANINSTDNEGATPLFYACRTYSYYHQIFKDKYQITFCKYLIKFYKAKKTIELNGEKINIKDKFLDQSCIIM